MSEIRFVGFGGQGIIRCGLIVGKAASLYDNKAATMTQSFGPEARGGACSSQLVISEKRVLYPYVVKADVLVAFSQEGYDKYKNELKDEGVLIVEKDLVKVGEVKKSVKLYSIPATRIAEELGNRVFTNVVMLGFFTGVTKIVSVESMRKAIPSSVPKRYAEINLKAFDQGLKYFTNTCGS